MIPDSLTAVLSFLLLIAPGIVWELQRTRHEPAVKESTLIEVSGVILASLAFTGLVTIPGSIYWGPLVGEVLSHGSPTSESPRTLLMVFIGIAGTSAAACGLAYGVARYKWPDKVAPITPGRVWDDAFRTWVPQGDIPYLTIEMQNGTVWRGTLASFDQDPEDDQRTIALKGPLMRKRPMTPPSSRPLFRRPAAPGFIAQDESDRFVLLQETHMASIKVEYYFREQSST